MAGIKVLVQLTINIPFIEIFIYVERDKEGPALKVISDDISKHQNEFVDGVDK